MGDTTKAIPQSLHSLLAHVIQLCYYIEDASLPTADLTVLQAKAKQVREVAWNFGREKQ